jgi:hypothetical protein
MDKIQKDINALIRVAQALLDRMESVERALGIQKAQTTRSGKTEATSLGSTIAKALASPTTPGRGEAGGAAVSKNFGRKGQ